MTDAGDDPYAYILHPIDCFDEYSHTIEFNPCASIIIHNNTIHAVSDTSESYRGMAHHRNTFKKEFDDALNIKSYVYKEIELNDHDGKVYYAREIEIEVYESEKITRDNDNLFKIKIEGRTGGLTKSAQKK